jgi:hypothetical protein
MSDARSPEPLDPQRAAHLLEFARGCGVAARAVSLYPAGHPSVTEALTRLTASAGSVTAAEPFHLTVLPDGLLLDGRSPSKPDPVLQELAHMLHQHGMSGLVLHDGGDATTWHSLLSLLTRPVEEIREAGGLGHLWSERGGLTTPQQRRTLEVRQLDYERLLRRQALGDPATLEELFTGLGTGRSGDLGTEGASAMRDIVGDPAKLELLAAELSERVAGDSGAQVDALMHLVCAGTEAATDAQGEPDTDRLANLAKLLAGQSAETVADLLRQRGRPDAMAGGRDAIETVTEHLAPDDILGFVSESIVADGGASHRLAEAFQALVPGVDERRQLVSRAGRQMAESPFGQTETFSEIWQRAETLLTSYDDQPYVHEEYAQELNLAKTQAIEVEHTNDDPAERVASWLATVDDPALRSLDLQLLLDLLVLERDPHRWRDIADTTCVHVEELTLSGDLPWALRLVDGLAEHRPEEEATTEADTVPAFASAAMDRLATGPALRHALAQLRNGGDTATAQVRRLCDTLGPAIVTSLSEVMAAERDARVRRSIRDILISFGARGRDAIRQLLDAPDWEARQTAAFLLREFGDDVGLEDLKRLLNDTEPLVQREAIRATVKVGDERAYQTLADVFAEVTPQLRTTLIQQLAAQRDERAIPLCRYLLTHLDHRARQDVYLAAIQLLGTLGGEPAVEPLRHALYRGEWWAPRRTRMLREAAAQALRRTRTPTAVQTLRDAVAQGPRAVRAVARAQLAQIEGRP